MVLRYYRLRPLAIGLLFLWPDVRLRPIVKNAASVIFWFIQNFESFLNNLKIYGFTGTRGFADPLQWNA